MSPALKSKKVKWKYEFKRMLLKLKINIQFALAAKQMLFQGHTLKLNLCATDWTKTTRSTTICEMFPIFSVQQRFGAPNTVNHSSTRHGRMDLEINRTVVTIGKNLMKTKTNGLVTLYLYTFSRNK